MTCIQFNCLAAKCILTCEFDICVMYIYKCSQCPSFSAYLFITLILIRGYALFCFWLIMNMFSFVSASFNLSNRFDIILYE